MAQVGLEWEDQAKEETRTIYDYLFDEAPAYAMHWADEIEQMLERLITFPEMGRMVPDIQVRSIREVFVGRYRMVYQFRDKKVVILAVRYMGQPLGKI